MSQFEPVVATLCQVRGDTKIHLFRVGTAANPTDITVGYSFVMTIDTLENPPDAATNVFFMTGVVVDGPTGLFSMQPTEIDSEALDFNLEYFYDVEVVSPTEKFTLFKGPYQVSQDITKS